MNAQEQEPVGNDSALKSSPLDNFRAIADAIATLFFPHAEVVLHDLRTQKVDYIANNLSKREIGDDSSLEDTAQAANLLTIPIELFVRPDVSFADLLAEHVL